MRLNQICRTGAPQKAVCAFCVTVTIGALCSGAAANGKDREADRHLRRTPVVEVFEQSRDVVVNISSTQIVTVQSRGFGGFDGIFEHFFDFPMQPRTRELKRQSVGSGFVIHPDGYIVTNAHVVARTAERKVTFADGREFEADIVATDVSRDLAILKIEVDGSLPVLPLGRSDDLMVGETVIAIGNPLGYQHTVTSGVVSAVGRDLTFPNEVMLQGLIQTDASINPGNSGGPLLNALGQLIGINTAIRGDAQNIGFAIPVDRLREVLPDLLDVERRYRIRAGLHVDTLAEPRVIDVEPGSPAEAAGIELGDALVAIDGKPIREGIEYYIALIGSAPERKLELTFRRGDETATRLLTLGARPRPDGRTLASEKLGLELHPLPEEVASRLGLRRQAGLLVLDIERGSPAAQLGVQQRDILLAIDRHYVADLEQLGELLEELRPSQVVTLTVLRYERRGSVQITGRVRIR